MLEQKSLGLSSLSLGRLRKRLFGLSPAEATFAVRGFRAGDAAARRQLELSGAAFLEGYHAALEEKELGTLSRRLNGIRSELRGFGFEGAAMWLALLDLMTPWRRDRWLCFVRGSGSRHTYMAHVGLGWALARLGRSLTTRLRLLDPLLGWLAVDGYGFHEGYFHWPRYVAEKTIPERLRGYARQVFDQGLGRSIWFVEGANVLQIPKTIGSFPPARRADLWSGIGLACAYAGGVTRTSVEVLRAAAGPFRPHLAQGAAFAAKTRQRAGNLTPHTETACRILCGLSADEAAGVTDAALANLDDEGCLPAYEVWRQRIRAQFAREAVSHAD